MFTFTPVVFTPVDATIAASSVTNYKLAFITSVVGTMKNNKLPAMQRGEATNHLQPSQ